jgi:HK97 family phage major capsid protein
MNIQAIRERRSGIVESMRTITQLAETEERDLSTKESKDFDEFRGQLKSLEGQLERAEVIADAERSMATDPNQPQRGTDGTFEQQCRSYQITKAIGARIEPGSVDAGREHEISQELAHRSGKTPQGFMVPHEIFEERAGLTTGTGGNLVPTVHQADRFIDPLRPKLLVQAMGATILSGLVGNQEIPKLIGSVDTEWLGEHSAVSDSDHTYGNVTLSNKTIGCGTEYSRRLILNAVPAVEQLVRRDFASMIAQGIDLAAIYGTGAASPNGDQPIGLLGTSGIGSVSFAGAPTWAKVLDHIANIEANNTDVDRMGWLTSPYVVKKMRSTVRVGSTDSRFIQDDPNSLAGYPLRSTTQINGDPTSSPLVTGALIFGNWADLLVGYWSAVDILVNPYHTDVYSRGGVKINAFQDCDVAVRHAESFCASTDMDLT